MGPMGGVHVILCKAAFFKDMLLDTKNIRKSSLYILITDFLGNHSLVLQDGGEWKEARKLLNPAFHYSVLEQFTSAFNRTADELCHRVKGQTVSNVHRVLSHYLLKSLLETSHVQPGDESILDEYLEGCEHYQECHSARMTNPMFQFDMVYNLSPTGRRRDRIVKKLHDFSTNAIKKRHEYLKSGNVDGAEDGKKCKSCLVDTLIREHIRNPIVITFDYIRSQLDAFIFAGHDTVSHTLRNTLFFIATHAHVQKRLHEEIDEMLDSACVETITTEMANKLAYLDAVIKESMRMIPAASVIGRTKQSETKIGDYTLPIGCYPFMNIFELHRDSGTVCQSK